jgi:hypothetical protein
MWKWLMRSKKIIVLLIAIVITCVASFPSLRAQTMAVVNYAQLIYHLLIGSDENGNSVDPGLVFDAMIGPDPVTSVTSSLKNAFQNYQTQYAASQTQQPTLLAGFLGTYFNGSPPNNANDLSYQTLLGTLLNNPDPRGGQNPPSLSTLQQNYIRNISGISLVHIQPDATWNGKTVDKTNYQNFYNLSVAAQTLNAYVLSQLYTDQQAGVSSSQSTLMTLATGKDWFVQVASESVGVVLRQILMFDSQIYVLLSQQLQTQKMLLAAQASTNTMLMANSMSSEGILLYKAMNQSQGP